MNHCTQWIRNHEAPQVDTDRLSCRPVLKDPEHLWHQRQRRNYAIAEVAKASASNALGRITPILTMALATAIKDEKKRNLPKLGKEHRAAMILLEEYLQNRGDFARLSGDVWRRSKR